MITFGYNSKFTGPLRALAALAIGIMMVVRPEAAFATVVKIIAVFLLATGLVSLVLGLKDKVNNSLPVMAVNAAVTIVLGLVLFIFPGFIARFIIYLIGFALFVFGLMQLITLFSARRAVGIGIGTFILPGIVTIVGFFMFFNPFAESVMSIMAGSALIIYGLSELISSWNMKKAIDEYEIHQTPVQEEQPEDQGSEPSGIKDVEYEKVDEQ